MSLISRSSCSPLFLPLPLAIIVLSYVQFRSNSAVPEDIGHHLAPFLSGPACPVCNLVPVALQVTPPALVPPALLLARELVRAGHSSDNFAAGRSSIHKTPSMFAPRHVPSACRATPQNRPDSFARAVQSSTIRRLPVARSASSKSGCCSSFNRRTPRILS